MSYIGVLPDDHIGQFVEIAARAYPGINIRTAEEKQRFAERLLARQADDPTARLYSLYRDNVLVGGMRLFDFRLNLLGHMLPAGGVGMVAVDLAHKKEKVAKELITAFLEHYHAQGATIAMLYPFRADFYKQMGFGFGTKINQYRIKPAQLPKGTSKQHIRFMTTDDVSDMLACYNRYAAVTHGMIERAAVHITGLLANPEYSVVGYERNDRIEGYLVFSFKPAKPDHFLLNDLQVEELIYEHPAALAELLTFLHSQADQFNTLVFNTQDEYLHFLLDDPRNTSNNLVPHVYHESNVQGIGIMYRVLDTGRLFEELREHNFGAQTVSLRLIVRDTFFPRNNRPVTIAFMEGRPTIREDALAQVEVELDVADFSSLVVGTVNFRRLHTYSRARISDAAYVPVIDALFAVAEKPMCVTRF